VDERIAKLPVWAQNHIADLASRARSLESQLDEANRALEAGPEDSEVFAESADVTRPLGRDVAVTFRTGAGMFTASLKDEALHIDGSRDLVLEPSSSFEVALRLK
jgi:hypothetical protein